MPGVAKGISRSQFSSPSSSVFNPKTQTVFILKGMLRFFSISVASQLHFICIAVASQLHHSCIAVVSQLHCSCIDVALQVKEISIARHCRTKSLFSLVFGSIDLLEKYLLKGYVLDPVEGLKGCRN